MLNHFHSKVCILGRACHFFFLSEQAMLDDSVNASLLTRAIRPIAAMHAVSSVMQHSTAQWWIERTEGVRPNLFIIISLMPRRTLSLPGCLHPVCTSLTQSFPVPPPTCAPPSCERRREGIRGVLGSVDGNARRSSSMDPTARTRVTRLSYTGAGRRPAFYVRRTRCTSHLGCRPRSPTLPPTRHSSTTARCSSAHGRAVRAPRLGVMEGTCSLECECERRVDGHSTRFSQTGESAMI
ncbi:hypothetical protein C8F04DRAFT_1399357 [Mycena alexandri]|uniref:Uncharacterized protein n=1 Tax=Mycena alexandri TaxID=1745969 RepID=A0AAD6WUE7_9AGAR|nr:hypothetical protein C8F04DRAFT_1399357 [Mycena alexandri]